MVEGVKPLGTADGRKTGGGETAAQDFRRGLANPVKTWLAGTVVKRKDEQNAACAWCTRTVAGGLAAGLNHNGEKQDCKGGG